MLGSTKVSTDRKISLIKEVADLLGAKEGDFIVFYLTKQEEVVIRKG
jgi:bifunctional DNA-binding transcriptional regulator/antitoxin component of YhaV-PrlF toxin-antitoxin module